MITEKTITPDQRMFIAVVQAFPINSLVNFSKGSYGEFFGTVIGYSFGSEVEIQIKPVATNANIASEVWIEPKYLNNQSFLNTLI